MASRSLGTLLHVFETAIALPKFAAFKYLDDPAPYRVPASKVVFSLKDSLDRMLSWAQTSFLAPRLIKVRSKLCSAMFISSSFPSLTATARIWMLCLHLPFFSNCRTTRVVRSYISCRSAG